MLKNIAGIARREMEMLENIKLKRKALAAQMTLDIGNIGHVNKKSSIGALMADIEGHKKSGGKSSQYTKLVKVLNKSLSSQATHEVTTF